MCIVTLQEEGTCSIKDYEYRAFIHVWSLDKGTYLV